MERRVAFYHPYFGFGGVERTNIRLSRYFISQGYKVDFIALGFENHYFEEMNKLGINRITLNGRKTIGTIGQLRQYMLNNSRNSELIFISCQNYVNVISAMAKPKSENIKLVLSERLHPTELDINIKGKITKLLMKLTYRKADSVLANSKATAAEIQKICGCNTKCIYNPTLSENLTVLAKEPIEDLGLDMSANVIVCTGRLEKVKGFDTLIKAVAIANREIDCSLLVVGDGKEKENLLKIAKEYDIDNKVFWAGYQNNPHKYVAKAKVFVLSSRREGLPNALIEAMAVGIPCISTRCPSGPEEILEDGKWGELVPVDDEESMAEAIVKVLKGYDEAIERSENAKTSLTRFTLENIGQEFVELFDSL